MALNCKLDRNITLSQPGDGGVDGCNGQDISMGVGGISSPVLVYNISDVPSLTFEGDNRSDYSLYVETINSVGKFYKVDHTDATYNEEYDPSTHKWTHTLTLTISNITPLFEDILSDGVNGKYLVCFRPNGAEDYRMFGWKYGATLDYSLNITSDSLGYTITFEDSSEYPLFTAARNNFGDKNKVYTPIFVPLYDVYYCEQDGNGRHTGYIVAMYVVKVNAAGQPLGSDNKLTQWTGKKQDAYKVAGIQSDGGYNIIGTYQKTATFDGKPVKVLDYEKCPANVTNSIFINSKKAETINLNSTISAGTFTITSTDDWMMVTDPQYVTISPVEGENGNTQCSVHHNGVGGCEQIKFMNKVTTEIVTLDVCVNIIHIGETYTYPHGTTDIVLTPIVEGCDSAFTYSITPSVTSSKDADGNIHITFPNADSELEYTMTTTHGCDPNEKKVTKIYRKGVGTDPKWTIVNSWCETNISTKQYTGYRIDRYIDYNPNSSTYMQDKEEKVLDSTCSSGSPSWVEVERYCELDTNGANTGYLVSVLQDLNQRSATYGQTQTTKVLNERECPAVNDNPKWILDPTFDPYCEQMIYEPSMVEGNTGRLIIQLFDDNVYSPTYNQRQESGVTEADWNEDFQRQYGDFPCETPNTDPDIEEVSYTCELSANTEDMLVMTGYKISTGLDKNPYSSTYLEVTSARTYDAVACPPNNPHVDPTGCTAFIVDGGHIDAYASGDTGCDSAFLYHEGIPVFTPSSASTWITINYYHWDTDSVADMCTNYASSPCVANSLMRAAGIVDNDLHCSDTPPHPLSDFPQEVQDAVNKTGKYAHALGTIEYVIAPNTGETSRSATVEFVVDSVECPSAAYTITQAGTGETPTGDCDCSTYDVRGLGVWASSAASSTEYTVARYTGATNCSQPFTFSLKSGDNFMGNFRASGGYVYAKCIQDNPGNTRQSQYEMKQGDCTGTIYINQQQKYTPPGEDVFQWNWQGHETNYSADTALNYLDLIQFSSVYNGQYTNAVISANVPWIVTDSDMYYNRNELTPNVNPIVYFTDYNTGSSARVGRLTLTQKGTSNKITCDIIQTVKPIDCSVSGTVTLASDEVCKGDNLSYTFTMNDSRCTTPPTFEVRDAEYNWTTITATSVGSGTGTGVINTSSMALGSAFIRNPSTSRIENFTVKDCGTPPQPSTGWTITLNARNITSNETIYVSGFELQMSGGSTLTYSQSQKVELVPGASSYFTSKTFTGSATEGETIDVAAMLVSASSSSGSQPQMVQCTITPTTLSNGTNYEIRYNGGLTRMLAVEEETEEEENKEENTEETER